MRVVFFIPLVALLCGQEAESLTCYNTDSRPGDDMCVANTDCTSVSRNVTCQGNEPACGYIIVVRNNYPEVRLRERSFKLYFH